ncbi:hypothetical protein H5410_020962 [Solanum commersonii]|uniref:Uncharacterized protein n=1 Tax=Solanum commersonii TaxID=4109 RepID=A0A9J5Z9Y5_SOLCO|nr:hypothetical protein H5410_020962 [Solanum commersonii]
MKLTNEIIKFKEKLQLEDELEEKEENNQDNLPEIRVDEINDDDLEQHSETSETYTELLANIDNTKNLEINTGDIDMDEKPSTSGITYHDKATQTETEEEDTIEKILKAITTLCTKVDSMDNEIQKLKTNEDNRSLKLVKDMTIKMRATPIGRRKNPS